METAFPNRLMPRFFVIGVQRGGASSFYSVLKRHPQIARSRGKDPKFFAYPSSAADRTKKGSYWPWYASQYPSSVDSSKRLAGDYSTTYFFDPHAAIRLRVAAPKAKIIVLLRDPVTRAYSNFQKRLEQGKIGQTFEQVVTKGISLWQECFDGLGAAGNIASSAILECPQPKDQQIPWEVIGRSLYYEQALLWTSVFPRDQILFIDTYTTDNPASEYNKVFTFLGLRPVNVKLASTSHSHSYEPMNEGTKQKLGKFFRQHNDRFAGLIGNYFDPYIRLWEGGSKWSGDDDNIVTKKAKKVQGNGSRKTAKKVWPKKIIRQHTTDRMKATDSSRASCPRPNRDPLPASLLEYTSPNEVLAQTVFLIQTYNRPEALAKLLLSLARYSPAMKVIVADDSTTEREATLRAVKEANTGKFCVEWPRENQWACKNYTNVDSVFQVEHIPQPEGSGVGFGRNFLVAEASKRGFKYLVMADDDYGLPSDQVLPRLAQVLLSLNADAVAPARCQFSADMKMQGCSATGCAAILRTSADEMTIMRNVTRSYDDDHIVHAISSLQKTSLPAPLTSGHKQECFRSDLIEPFFLAKTAAMVDKWDPELKNNAHYDAMLSMQEDKLRLYTCRAVHIAHINPAQGSSKWKPSLLAYKKEQTHTWRDFLPLVFKKWKLKSLWDEKGRHWQINVEGKAVNQYGPKLNEKAGVWEHGDADLAIQASLRETDVAAEISSAMNRYRAGWDTIEIVDGSSAVTNLNPCQKELHVVATHVRYPARHSGDELEHKLTWSAAEPKRDFAAFYIQAACPFLEQLLNIVAPQAGGTLHVVPKHLYFVSISNRGVDTMLETLKQQVWRGSEHGPQTITLLLVMMGTDGLEADWKSQSAALLDGSEIAFEILELGPPFGRAIGLRAGYAYVNSMVGKAGQDPKYVVVQSLDGSLLLPSTFSVAVMENVRCGLSVYAPVFKKEERWTESSFGMLGVCLNDYNDLVLDGCGWRESWWYHWGAEDMDMSQQLRTRFFVLRPRLAGFKHRNSKGSRTSNPGYYADINKYPDYIPVIPVSLPVENKFVREKLVTFARAELPSLEFEDSAVILTTNGLQELSTSFYSIWAAKGELVIVSRAEAEGEFYVQDAWRLRERLMYGMYDPRQHSMVPWQQQ
jgi:glycosyltransferase involved in cell wall biosynthesis